MRKETREALEVAMAFGFRNSGYGYTTAKMIKMILEEEDKVPPPKYPCVPTPFDTVMGTVMMCKRCGHGYDKPDDCPVKDR